MDGSAGLQGHWTSLEAYHRLGLRKVNLEQPSEGHSEASPDILVQWGAQSLGRALYTCCWPKNPQHLLLLWLTLLDRA